MVDSLRRIYCCVLVLKSSFQNLKQKYLINLVAKNHSINTNIRISNLFSNSVSNFEFCIGGYDAQKLKEGEILVKLDCMSVDPYMRSRMSGDGPGIVKNNKLL